MLRWGRVFTCKLLVRFIAFWLCFYNQVPGLRVFLFSLVLESGYLIWFKWLQSVLRLSILTFFIFNFNLILIWLNIYLLLFNRFRLLTYQFFRIFNRLWVLLRLFFIFLDFGFFGVLTLLTLLTWVMDRAQLLFGFFKAYNALQNIRIHVLYERLLTLIYSLFCFFSLLGLLFLSLFCFFSLLGLLF